MAARIVPKSSWTNTREWSRCCYCAFRKAVKSNGVISRWKHTECSVEVEVGKRRMQFSTGKMAKLADGAVVAKHGENAALVTAVSSYDNRIDSPNNLHLTVDYKEKAGASGIIPSSFLRRELMISERDVLISRCIDRSLRPLFPKRYPHTIQVISSLLAADGFHNPDIAGMNGASAALTVSDIPWSGPIGVVRIGEIDGEFVVNPTWSQLHFSCLNLVLACSEKKIVMIEAFAKEINSDRFCEAIRFGFDECQPLIEALNELQKQAGKEKRIIADSTPPSEIFEAVQRFSAERFDAIFSNFTYSKLERDKAMFSLIDECRQEMKGSFPAVDEQVIEDAIFTTSKSVFRGNTLEKLQRCDGREFRDLRPISCEVDLFKPLHGSALFQRGQTQVFCTATIGSLRSAKRPDSTAEGIGDVKDKPFMLHYEFPPFCTGESGRLGGPRRREIGHGNLAEKALRAVVPDDFPFAVRVTSQVLESNGSSSIASACAGSLALMDAGVPITRPVGGVACGLVTSSDAEDPNKPDIDRYQLLTDILGIEDFMGDMDFKIAGTRHGITALQADVKIPGLPLHIVEEAVKTGSEDRLKVLDVMEECQRVSRESPKMNTPVQTNVFVPQTKCGKLVGVGGFNIKNLQDETGSTINRVDEEQFQVFAPNTEILEKTVERINELLTDKDWTTCLEVGATYTATIVEVRDYGVLVELVPNTPSLLLHVSEMSHRRILHPRELGLIEGSTIDVKYLGKDSITGRVSISRKALLQRPSPPPSKKPSETEKHDDFIATFFK